MKISQLVIEAPATQPRIPGAPVQTAKATQQQATQPAQQPGQDPKTQQIKTQVQKTAQQPAQQQQVNRNEYEWKGAQWINKATGKIASRDVSAKLGNPKIDELITQIVNAKQTELALQFLQSVDKTKQAAKQNVPANAQPVKQGMFEADQSRVAAMAKKYQVNIAQGITSNDIERIVKGEVTDAVKDDRIKVGQGKPSAMAHLGKQFRAGQDAADAPIKGIKGMVDKVDKALGGAPPKIGSGGGGSGKDSSDSASSSKTKSGMSRLKQQLDIKNPNLAISGMSKMERGEKPNQQEIANMAPLLSFMKNAVQQDPQRLVQLIQKYKK